MATTRPVSFEVEFDREGSWAHVGLIALNTDETTERDFQTLRPKNAKVGFYTSRISTVNPVTIDNLRKMGPQLGHAASLILPDITLKAVAYGCTSGTLALGYEEVAKQVKSGLPAETRDNVLVVTPLTAALQAFHELGLKRVAMLTPYIDAVNRPMKIFFEDQGIRIVKLDSLMVESDVDIARVQPSSIVRGALEVCSEEADAVFLSCTALRAVECVNELEQKLGVPVLSSNLCMFWQLMKAAGYRQPIVGHGSLLAQYLV